MALRTATIGRTLLVAALVALAAGTVAHAAGFALFEQGSSGMGVGGAFTATADDPSAVFHNPAGLAYQRHRGVLVGFTTIRLGDATFEGRDPYPGKFSKGHQINRYLIAPHLYYSEPLPKGFVVALGVNAPYGLATDWQDPYQWSGRFVSNYANLQAIDINPSLAYAMGKHWAFGVGVAYRMSKLELEQHAAAVNPFTLQATDVAASKLESDMNGGWGWNVGIMHRPTDKISLGLTYRSKVKIDYNGTGRLTQVPSGNATFDALVASSLPFDRDLGMTTGIEYPDMWSLGFAYQFTKALRAEIDVNRTGWSSFHHLDITFTDHPDLSKRRIEDWNDVNNYRLGLRIAIADKKQLHLGVYYDETPQPSTSTSPLLPDANRSGLSLGYAFQSGSFKGDVALLWVHFNPRTVDASHDGFNGTYRTDVLLLGLTAGW